MVKVESSFKDNADWKVGNINYFYDFQYGLGNNIPSDEGKYPVYGSNGIVSHYSKYNNEESPVIGHVGVPGSLFFAFGKHYVTYNGVLCFPKKESYRYYGYCMLASKNLQQRVRGTSQSFLSYDILNGIETIIPTEDFINNFNDLVKPIFNQINKNQIEIAKLHSLKEILISKISNKQ